MESNKLNINRFAEAYARALTVQFQKKYPGIQITVKMQRRVMEEETKVGA